MAKVRAVVTDIEGTTSSIDFVHQTLFPFAKARLRSYLLKHANDGAVRQVLHEVEDLEQKALSIDQASDVLERWISEDRKVTPLKTLQGMIWGEGYATGQLEGHVYADTAPALRRWHDQGLKLYVYSSGSVEAQKLIFGHTQAGDLTPFFAGYFDTRIGAKREAGSYRAILAKIGVPGDEVIFLSDVGEELDAAREAGMRTLQLLRDDKVKPSAAHQHASDFTKILP